MKNLQFNWLNCSWRHWFLATIHIVYLYRHRFLWLLFIIFIHFHCVNSSCYFLHFDALHLTIRCDNSGQVRARMIRRKALESSLLQVSTGGTKVYCYATLNSVYVLQHTKLATFLCVGCFVCMYMWRLIKLPSSANCPSWENKNIFAMFVPEHHGFLSRRCGYPRLYCWDALKQHASGTCVSDLGDHRRYTQGLALGKFHQDTAHIHCFQGLLTAQRCCVGYGFHGHVLFRHCFRGIFGIIFFFGESTQKSTP